MPDRASPDGASPDSASPDGASPDGTAWSRPVAGAADDGRRRAGVAAV